MIYLGIGANLGDRMATMRQALEMLELRGGLVLDCSPVFETAAWGGAAQGSFLNAVVEIAYQDTAPKLLDTLLHIENLLGRIRQVKWGNRLIDLDILEFHREVWSHPLLHLPHPGYTSRAFVLAPFAAFRPDFLPTGSDSSVSDLLPGLDTHGVELSEEPLWI